MSDPHFVMSIHACQFMACLINTFVTLSRDAYVRKQ